MNNLLLDLDPQFPVISDEEQDKLTEYIRKLEAEGEG